MLLDAVAYVSSSVFTLWVKLNEIIEEEEEEEETREEVCFYHGLLKTDTSPYEVHLSVV